MPNFEIRPGPKGDAGSGSEDIEGPELKVRGVSKLKDGERLNEKSEANEEFELKVGEGIRGGECIAIPTGVRKGDANGNVAIKRNAMFAQARWSEVEPGPCVSRLRSPYGLSRWLPRHRTKHPLSNPCQSSSGLSTVTTGLLLRPRNLNRLFPSYRGLESPGLSFVHRIYVWQSLA